MGIGSSTCIAELSPLRTGLDDLPESCVALVLSYLDPPEICKFGGLNRVFRRASWADLVWESKLPENYPRLVKEVLNESDPKSLCKRDVYARLCHPTLFDGGTKEVWMEKRSGKIGVSVSWKGMKITGIDDRRYWNPIPSNDESRFDTIAYLQQIWWLEVEGHLEFRFPPGTYSIYFRLHLGRPTKRFCRRTCDLDQTHGWDIKPVQFKFSTSNGQHATSQCYLNEPGKWIRYHIGDFVVDNGNAITEIKFSMAQIDCTHSKSGMCFDSVLILPK